MPGMNSGLNAADPAIVSAFRSALLHQGLIAAALFVLLWLAWGASRGWVEARPRTGPRWTEPRGRWLLRAGFGVLWIFDGILQAQPKMAAGMPSQVIEPTAANSPSWVQHVVNWGGTAWSYHPIQAGASAVWIQAGLGIWLLAAARGRWSRLAGLASAGWGLVVWVWGESFGGIFAPGLTWLFGAPGAVLLYAVAGVLIALPDRAWRTPRTGRLVLAGAGVFFAGMAVLQAWPGRGFWPGTSHGQPGTLTAMVQSMAQTSQPHVLSALVASFGSFDAAHGFAVNLFVVIALAALGTAFLTGRRQVVRAAVAAGIVLCLADWVLIEDLGFLGGLGTDPNSMLPMILLFTSGYLALTPVRVPVPVPVAVPAEAAARDGEAAQPAAPGGRDTAPGGWRGWLRPERLREAVAVSSVRSVTAAGSVAVIVLGAAPMAAASANRNADPVIAQAIAGDSVNALNQSAAPFQLTDQNGRTVTLASLRGKVVLLTFLDPVCVSDCPLIAQEVRAAGQLLGSDAQRVELVAIVLNPMYYTVAYTRAFDRQENMDTVPNWRYLTGTPAALERIWSAYGVLAEISPGGAMVAHSDLAFVIDRSGIIQKELSDDPGPGTASSKSSFAVLLSDAARQTLAMP